LERYPGLETTSIIDKLITRITILETTILASQIISADVMLLVSGTPTESQTFVGAITRALTWPADGEGSEALALVVPDADVEIILRQNGVQFGTVTFEGGEAVGIFDGTETTFAPGDSVEFVFPETADATFANIGISLLMLRGDDPVEDNTGLVLSVFSRTGTVVGQLGDYTTDLISDASVLPGTTLTDVLNLMATEQVNGEIIAFGTTLATGTNKYLWVAPYNCTLLNVQVDLGTAQTSGSLITVDVNKAGSTIMTTRVTVDNGENTSRTAATPAAIASATIALGDRITFDLDTVGDGTAQGLFFSLRLRKRA
jgi:hypothetical protein